MTSMTVKKCRGKNSAILSKTCIEVLSNEQTRERSLLPDELFRFIFMRCNFN